MGRHAGTHPSHEGLPTCSDLLDSLARIDGKAHLLVDRQGAVVATSCHAPALLGDRRSLRIDHGHLRQACAAEAASLRRLLDAEHGQVEEAVFSSDSGQHPILARACEVNEELLCLVLAAADAAYRQQLPDLCMLFGLTPCEADVVRDLLSGHTPQWIARNEKRSIHTIRAHIRRSYSKIGINCREELWDKVYPYCI